MAVREVLTFPDPRLRTPARPVEVFDEGLAALVTDLFETMYAAPAIGLAATQVDVHMRVLVMDCSGDRSEPMVFVNPQVLSSDAVGWVEEQCASVPGRSGLVKRATRLRVEACDPAGARFEKRLQGLAAVCLLHEMDHLDGRLFVDRLSWLARMRLRAAMAFHGRSAVA
jgi:peptide deformylase